MIEYKKRTRQQWIIRCSTIILVLLVAMIFLMLVKAYIDGEFKTVESLQNYIQRYGALGPLMLVFVQAAQVVIPVLPGFLGCAVGSVLYGPWIGFWCNYIGISVGSVIAFFLAKKLGERLLQDLFSGNKYKKWAERAGKSRSYAVFVFLAMLLPLFPDDYICYLTGTTQMTARKFIWIVILGKPWCILAYSLGFALI
ncbi:MAG: TVP38/TMEM64 family protein [Lachnospiraceae bacterium]|nr:TVP38/TMEM64 family protein [Lachnospiraceae bacterium]